MITSVFWWSISSTLKGCQQKVLDMINTQQLFKNIFYVAFVTLFLHTIKTRKMLILYNVCCDTLYNKE